MMTALGYHYFVYWTSSCQPFLCIANYIFTFCQSGFFNPVMFYLDYFAFSQREKALIFYQILSTSYTRKCMEIRLKSLYVDLGA